MKYLYSISYVYTKPNDKDVYHGVSAFSANNKLNKDKALAFLNDIKSSSQIPEEARVVITGFKLIRKP